MGAFTASFQVGNPAGTEFVDVTALVDTGSIYTFLPGEILTRLGVEPEDREQFELADSRIVEYPIGNARMRLRGKERIVPVIFGPEGADALLGVTSLEILGLGVDPVNQRLIPVRLPLK